MTVTTAIKRETPEEDDIKNDKANKRAKTQPGNNLNKKECQNCYWAKLLNQFPRSSANCGKKHSNEICRACWTGYFKTDVMDKGNDEFPCLPCGSQMDFEDDFKRLASKEMVEHYLIRRRRNNMAKNSERECLADIKDSSGKTVTCHTFQTHDILTDGRIFTCTTCNNSVCVPCSVPEHLNENCSTFQTRLHLSHGDEEAATQKAFEENYYLTSTNTKRKINRMRCPFCGIMTERSSGSYKVRCRAPNHGEGPMMGGCGIEFCHNDGATYLGKGSVPEGGNGGHKVDCRLRKDDDHDWRLSHRAKRELVVGVGKEEEVEVEKLESAEVKKEEGDGEIGD